MRRGQHCYSRITGQRRAPAGISSDKWLQEQKQQLEGQHSKMPMLGNRSALPTRPRSSRKQQHCHCLGSAGGPTATCGHAASLTN